MCAVAGVPSLAGCASAPVPVRSSPAATVDTDRIIPWIDSPAPPLQPTTPSPTPTRPTDARPCAAAEVSTSFTEPNGAGGHKIVYAMFRNVSDSICVLTGYPHVTATGVGLPDVVATDGSFFPSPGSANVAPGQDTWLGLETDSYCAKSPGGGDSGPVYSTVTVDLPVGGTVMLQGHAFGLTCGLRLTPFFVPLPVESPAPDPIGELTAALEIPPTVAAGTTLSYVVRLTNPTEQAISLQPCPGYIQHTPATPTVKQTYALNCTPAAMIGAHATVRFEMRMHLPDATAPGKLPLYWALIEPGESSNATAQLTVT